MIISVCSVSHADVFYVNSLYVCVVYSLIENTYGICNSTYLCLSIPKHLATAHIYCASLGKPSWAGIVSAQAGWRSASGAGNLYSWFPLPVAPRLLKGALSHWATFQARSTYRHSQGSRAPPWSGGVHTLSDCRYDISHLYCVVDLIYYTWSMCIWFASDYVFIT